MTVLEATLRKQYPSGFELNATFRVEPGFNILFGASGSGKTTILDCLAGLAGPTLGVVTLGDSQLVDSERGVCIAARRRHCGYVMQSQALFPNMSARGNVEFGARSAGCAQQMLNILGIAELADRRPAQLSAGQRQRVALARTLASEPRYLLMDEPLAALDPATKLDIVCALRTWNQQRCIPILYVTHDREEAYALGERMIVLENGKIIATGTPHEVLAAPIRHSVAQLAGFENVLECEAVEEHHAQGTMSCRIAGSQLLVEAPLTRVESVSLRLGIRAGDILLASRKPVGISARNVWPGAVRSIEIEGVLVRVKIESSGVILEAHVTPAARDALKMEQGSAVWLVIKTYSCHILQ